MTWRKRKLHGAKALTVYQNSNACTGQLIPQASPRSPRLLFADAERPTIERRDGKI